MKLGYITSYFDVAQVAIWAFLLFFAGLVYWIRREDRREGYPLYSEPSNKLKSDRSLLIPPAKTFFLPHGGTVMAPDKARIDMRDLRAAKVEPWPGAPIAPSGDPMLAAVGPGSYAERSNTVDLTHEGTPKIVPLRVATIYEIAEGDADPRGMAVIGGDGKAAGTVKDVWVDRSETILRYLEVDVAGAGKTVLLPVTFARIDGRKRRVTVNAIFARHFAQVPALANASQVTLLEEDKICAYYGAGTLYASPDRQEPLL